jgi:conjugative transfer signal peptidase TraF
MPLRGGLASILRLLLVVAMAIAALLAPTKSTAPILLWNASPSIPIGLYMTANQAPAKEHLAIIRLPDVARALASARGYLPAGALLIKPVAAVSGDVVCRRGPLISINARLRAIASTTDKRKRFLPRWHGCRTLRASELFVLSPAGGSFDSRYLGPIEHGNVLGTAVAIWTR